MDVDGTALEVAAALRGQDLHVAGEYEELGFHPLVELDQSPLLLAPVDDRQLVVR